MTASSAAAHALIAPDTNLTRGKEVGAHPCCPTYYQPKQPTEYTLSKHSLPIFHALQGSRSPLPPILTSLAQPCPHTHPPTTNRRILPPTADPSSPQQMAPPCSVKPSWCAQVDLDVDAETPGRGDLEARCGAESGTYGDNGTSDHLSI